MCCGSLLQTGRDPVLGQGSPPGRKEVAVGVEERSGGRCRGDSACKDPRERAQCGGHSVSVGSGAGDELQGQAELQPEALGPRGGR